VLKELHQKIKFKAHKIKQQLQRYQQTYLKTKIIIDSLAQPHLYNNRNQTKDNPSQEKDNH